MGSGVTVHSLSRSMTFGGSINIDGKLLSPNNRIYVAAGDCLVESNAVGTIDAVDGKISFAANGLTDYFHLGNVLRSHYIGASMQITRLTLYTSSISGGDKIDSVKVYHYDLNTETLGDDWEDPDDKASGTVHPYTGINVTIENERVYFIEIALDAGTTNFDLYGFLIEFDYV